jgi:lipoate-protein ligase A
MQKTKEKSDINDIEQEIKKQISLKINVLRESIVNIIDKDFLDFQNNIINLQKKQEQDINEQIKKNLTETLLSLQDLEQKATIQTEKLLEQSKKLQNIIQNESSFE